ncbi:MAG: dehypoxanthine futalosine cyclase [Bacteroidales bacterium]|nr:dehypoxanthine futalosine cyclase [Bacteroidales bacterium]
MNIDSIISKALVLQPLTLDEGVFLYRNAPLSVLSFAANEIKNRFRKPEDRNKVGWIIDRNINLSNICVTRCKFCNFSRSKNSPEAYVTTMEQYREKISALFAAGGNQVLLQGGMNPDFGMDFYCKLFSDLKREFPGVVLHALGPAEVAYLSKTSNLSYREVLEKLHASGLDSLPGAGAEILVDRVRKIVSPAKCSAVEWLEVMHQAHVLNLPTSCTMMFGHVETLEERIQHLIALRDTQARKPEYSQGFVTFIPWPFCSEDTRLVKEYGMFAPISGEEYIRLIAISRLMLNNIANIQASWLTVGKEIAQICLHSGANDFGSIMMEEHVVSAAGAKYSLDSNEMIAAIRQAGFVPVRRNSRYEFVE